MKKLLLSLFVITLLMGAACSSKVVNKFRGAQDTIVETEKAKDLIENHNSEIINKKVEYVLYENKAIGYSIMRPDGWYWQHFMKSDLETAGINKFIDDYLILDKNGIAGLESEYLGQIVIEKSRISLGDLAKSKESYNTKTVTVAGQSATRFEKETQEDDLLFPNKKIIEYDLARNGMIFRLIYTSSSSTNENEAIFEKIVASFSFDKTNSNLTSNDKYYCNIAADCVGNKVCHPTEFVNKKYAPDLINVSCTASCEGPIDCGAGYGECQNNKCVIVSKNK